MKTVLKVGGILLAVFVIFGVFAFVKMAGAQKDAMANLVYETADINTVADGTYYGEADAGLVYVKVGVTVHNHKIQNIDIIEHKNGLGAKAESITQDIIEKNNYDVDAVSGATMSSEAIKSAVSKALKVGSGA